jgi:hypothetical protein
LPMMTRNAPDLWSLLRLRIGYSHSTMTNDERMQRESNLIATIRKKLPEFAKASRMTWNWCYFTKTPLPLTTKRTNSRFSAWRSSTQGFGGRKFG